MADTLTVKELVKYLNEFPEETQVFISRDSEGNGFGTLSSGGMGTEYHEEDKAMVLYPMQENMEFDEVFPKNWEAQE